MPSELEERTAHALRIRDLAARRQAYVYRTSFAVLLEVAPKRAVQIIERSYKKFPCSSGRTDRLKRLREQ